MGQRDFEGDGRTIAFKPVQTPEGATRYWDVCKFKFLHDCMEGSGGFLGRERSYLVVDKTENYYNTRKLQSHFINDMTRFINAQFERIFSDIPIKYDTNDAGLEAMLNDIDRRGSHVDSMKQYAIQYCLLDGTVFMASGNDGEAGKQPWVMVYTALELQEDLCEYDQFKNITKYVFKVADKTYHVYTATNFYELEDKDNKCKLDEMAVVRKSEAPEQVVRPIYSLPSYGKTILPFPRTTYAIAKMELNLFELHSRMVQVMTRQLFDRLVITGDIDSVPEGTTNAIQITSENGNAQLLSPDANVTKTWKEVIEMYTMVLYEHMRDAGVIVQRTSQIPESGASKVHTFQPVEASYRRSILVLEKMDDYAKDAYNLFMSKSAKLEVTYNRSYTPISPLTALDLRDLKDVASGLGVRALKQEIARKMADVLQVDKTSELYKRIESEIETMTDGLAE